MTPPAATMRAAAYERTGPAREVLTLQDLPRPEPRIGEVRIKVATSGINPSDVKARAGRGSRSTATSLKVPHSDGAGTIDATGDGIDPDRVGERVWMWNAAWGRSLGTAAEFVVLPADQAVRLPDHTDLVAGACLGIPALTALHAVAMDGGVEGKTVLISGGAGAVGHYAVQFARLAGARQVIATVSSEAKAQLAMSAGAEVTVNYRNEDAAPRILDLTSGLGVDRIIEVDLSANADLDMAVLAPRGDVIVYGSNDPNPRVPFFAAVTKHAQLRHFLVYNLSISDRWREIAMVSHLLERRMLVHNVTDRLPLDQIAAAHELVESGTALGNVVLVVDESQS